MLGRMRLAGFLNHDNQFMVMCVSGEHPQVLRWDAVGEEELVGRFFLDNVGCRNVTFYPVVREWNCMFWTIDEIRKDMPMFADVVLSMFFRGVTNSESPWQTVLLKIAEDHLALNLKVKGSKVCDLCAKLIYGRCWSWVESEESRNLMNVGRLYDAMLKVLELVDCEWERRIQRSAIDGMGRC